MNTKHTPGPWVIDYDTRPAEVCTIHQVQEHGEDEQRFLYVRGALGYWDATDDENLANAKLMAAAPELLEALQKCLKSMETGMVDFNPFDQANWDSAKAAIKKATE